MEDTLCKKRQMEQQLSAQMIALYCRSKHKSPKGTLCRECQELAQYAARRTQHCPRMAQKTFCSTCPHPCYNPEMRQSMRKVMKYAGPRMLLHHPWQALRHLVLAKSL